MVKTSTSFSALALQSTSLRALTAMGITQPTPIQAQAIPALLQGRDVIGQARTGSGKTLAFALPLVERCDRRVAAIQALVLVPTRELAIQVAEVIGQVAAPAGLRWTLLYGGRALGPERQTLERGTHIIVGTPGRTLDHLRQGSLVLPQLRFLVLDEGDEMLDRGFAPDVEQIIGRTPRTRQTALFSATMPPWVATTAARHLHDPVTVQVEAAQTAPPPEIEHTVYELDPSAKLDALKTLLDQRDGEPVLVFGRTKHGVKRLARQLGQLGYPAAALQGNLSQNARERVMADFRSGQTPILLATNVAARGLDVEGLGQVINYELPESPELFTHRVGRTGRMGRKGEAITLVTPEDAPKLRQIERALGRSLPRRNLLVASGRSPARASAPAPAVVPAPRLASPPIRTPSSTRDLSPASATPRPEPRAVAAPPRREAEIGRPGQVPGPRNPRPVSAPGGSRPPQVAPPPRSEATTAAPSAPARRRRRHRTRAAAPQP